MHQTIKGITIMNEQILATGTDRNYAAALDWIKQAAASRKTLSLPGDEGRLRGPGRRASPGNNQRARDRDRRAADQADAERSLARPRGGGCAR